MGQAMSVFGLIGVNGIGHVDLIRGWGLTVGPIKITPIVIGSNQTGFLQLGDEGVVGRMLRVLSFIQL
jgi:hypothetical protein